MQHVNKINKPINFQDKDTIPWAASCWYLKLYPEANYAMYHFLCAFEAAGCTLSSLNTDFRTGQCRYFFQAGMNLSIEQRQGMPHTLVERCNTQKSLCLCSCPSTHSYLSESVIHGKKKAEAKKSQKTRGGKEILNLSVVDFIISYLSSTQ